MDTSLCSGVPSQLHYTSSLDSSDPEVWGIVGIKELASVASIRVVKMCNSYCLLTYLSLLKFRL